MNKKLVERRLDFNNMPPLTKSEKAQLEALKAMPDETIDTSDIPELDENFWKNAQRVRERFYKPIKQSTTVRIDADVLAWLKAKGKGYQTRINAILREAMVREG